MDDDEWGWKMGECVFCCVEFVPFSLSFIRLKVPSELVSRKLDARSGDGEWSRSIMRKTRAERMILSSNLNNHTPLESQQLVKLIIVNLKSFYISLYRHDAISWRVSWGLFFLFEMIPVELFQSHQAPNGWTINDFQLNSAYINWSMMRAFESHFGIGV